MQLTLKTDLSCLPEVIEFNYSELKEEMKQRLQKYNNIVVTAENIKIAKSDKATLNRLITAIEAERKEIKKVFLEPYTEFEAKCKELVAIIKEPANAIDMQIKDFENVIKEQKYAELKVCYIDYVGDMLDIIDFDKILNPKWSNTTAKIDNLKAEIKSTIDRIKEEISMLHTEYADKSYKSAVIAEYCKDYNLSKALTYAAQLRNEEEKQKKIIKKPNTGEVSQLVSVIKSEPIQISEEPNGTISFKVTCSKNQLISLREFMKSNGIKFEVLR